LFVWLFIGEKAIPVMWEFFKRYSSAEMAKQADVQPMADLLQPLGLYKKRAEIIIRFSSEIVTIPMSVLMFF
jgi:methyl-CpG-binding domain protein 4